MLLEQLQELLEFGMVAKKSYDGYPLKVEYSLAERGVKLLEAISIMQSVGVDLMKENGMNDILRANGFIE